MTLVCWFDEFNEISIRAFLDISTKEKKFVYFFDYFFI